MSAVSLELEQTLRRLDAGSAAALERLVRDALALVHAAPGNGAPAVDANGWPAGYFEKTAGSFADEPLDFPSDPPPEPIRPW